MTYTVGGNTKQYYAPLGTSPKTTSLAMGTLTDGLLVVKVCFYSPVNNAVTSITLGGTGLTKAVSRSYSPQAGLYYNTEIWFLTNLSGGTNDLVMSFSGSGTSAACTMIEDWWNGADTGQSTVLDYFNSYEGTTDPSGNIIPTEDGELLISFYLSEANNVLTVGSGETKINDQDMGAQVSGASYAIQTTAATQTMDWTGVDSYWCMCVASFRPASAAQDNLTATDITTSPPVLGTPTLVQTHYPTIALNTADGANLDTTPTLEFTGSDLDDDDLRYNIQISSTPTFIADGIQITDNYSAGGGGVVHPNPVNELTWEGVYQVDDRPGQSFTAKGGILDKISVRFGSDTATDGTAYIRVYAHTGVYGTSSAPLNYADPQNTPTPDWLAKSDGMVFGTGQPVAWRDFTFSGANRINLIEGEYYIFILDWVPNNTTYANTITTQHDSSTLGHGGNVYMDGREPTNNRPWSELDMHFRVYQDLILLDKISGTDSGFVNTVTGGDTDPFNAGEKISFTVQVGDALPIGATYYWRVRVKDPGGSNVYSDWSTSRSFTTGTILEANDITTSDPILGTPSIGQTHELVSGDITSGIPELGMPALGSGPTDLVASDITTSDPILGTPSIGQIYELISNNITTDNPVLDTPSIGQTHELVSNDITTSDPILGTPSIGQTHELVSNGITSGIPILGTPSIGQTHELVSNDITSGNPVLGTPNIGQTHELLPNAITSGIPLLGTPILSQELPDELTATDITSGIPELGTPILGQTHILNANGITTGIPNLEKPTISQTHILNANGITTGIPELETPTLTSGFIHDLVATDIVSGIPDLGTSILSEIHALVPVGIVAGIPIIESPSISQTHILLANNVLSGIPTLDKPIFWSFIPTPTDESRIYHIPSEDRTIIVEEEDRTIE